MALGTSLLSQYHHHVHDKHIQPFFNRVLSLKQTRLNRQNATLRRCFQQAHHADVSLISHLQYSTINLPATVVFSVSKISVWQENEKALSKWSITVPDINL